MKIISIFAKKLFAIQYSNDTEDIYTTLMEKWTDVYYVREFVKEHKVDIKNINVNQVVQKIIADAQAIDDTLLDLAKDKQELIDQFFVPLSLSEHYVQLLSKEKGKVNYNTHTRIYGIKIESDCYIITGGAIKFTQKMQDRHHTKKELQNINQVREYLISENIVDKDALLDLLNE